MKLMDPTTSAKTYWSILERCLNDRKIPCIRPLFHDNKFITDFKEKAELLNSFFSKQCSIIDNGSKLPSNLVYHTDEKLSDIVFNSEDIGKLISGLDPNKAHGHDMISICMLKICGESIHKPLESIFRASLNDGRFSSEWKKANVVPIHKKDDKQIYNMIFEYLIENNLITENQSGFKPGDSCINQLLSITHDIYKSLDDGFEVKGVFLDISKAFDKVCHEDLIYKLKQSGISGKLLNIIKDFLDSRKQSSTKRAIFIFSKYYSRGASRFNLRAFVLSYLYQRFIK